MEVKIYIDVLLVINLIFNYLLLWLTGLLLQLRIPTARLLLTAFLGALYAVFSFFMPDSLLFGLAGKLLAGILMTALSFRPRCFRVCIKYICVFYASVFILGGAAFSFFYFSDSAASLGSVYRNGTLYINLPIYLLLLLCLACYLLLKVTFSVGGRLSRAGKRILRLRVVYKGRVALLRGYYDSGNLLRDEISGKSVIVAEWNSMKKLFEKASSLEEAGKSEGVIAIAYQTLQGSSLLPALLPDKMYIESKRRLWEIEPVYIGLIDTTLDYYNKWDAILPHDFEGVETHEQQMDTPAAGLL